MTVMQVPVDGAQRPVSIFFYLFFLSLIVPPEVAVSLGGLHLPVYRIVLLIAFFPCLIRAISGRNGRLNAIDLLILCYALWAIVALIRAHGVERWQFFGITLLETMVPYLIARTSIQSAEDFRRFVRFYFAIILIILPFAAIETFTGNHILREVPRSIFGGVVFEGRPARLGLERAYGPFEHPIHYGLFCAASLGLVLSLRRTIMQTLSLYVTILMATFLSLSSGPLLLFVVQSILKVWDYSTTGIRKRWFILSGIFATIYFIIDIFSNRTPFHVLVTYATFRLQSAYNRIHIFNFGMESVYRHPFFGIGLNEWERPAWMSSSVDNFWLVLSMRYGVPAMLFLLFAIIVLFWRISRVQALGDAFMYRNGWGISMAGLMIAGATVHFWTELYCLFMFMIGSAFWILRCGPEEGGLRPEEAPADRAPGPAAAPTRQATDPRPLKGSKSAAIRRRGPNGRIQWRRRHGPGRSFS